MHVLGGYVNVLYVNCATLDFIEGLGVRWCLE